MATRFTSILDVPGGPALTPRYFCHEPVIMRLALIWHLLSVSNCSEDRHILTHLILTTAQETEDTEACRG